MDEINNINFMLNNFFHKMMEEKCSLSSEYYDEDILTVCGEKSWTMKKHTVSYEIVNEENEQVQDFLHRNEEAKQLLIELSSNIDILDSIYNNKLKFMSSRGNFVEQIRVALTFQVVCRLKDLIHSKSKKKAEVENSDNRISLIEMRNFISAHRQQLFEDYKVTEAWTFEKPLQAARFEAPKFDLNKLIELIDRFIESDKVKLLCAARNDVCAHLPSKTDYVNIKGFTYKDIKILLDNTFDIYNAISLFQDFRKVIKPTRISFSNNIEYINRMAEYGEAQKKELCGFKED